MIVALLLAMLAINAAYCISRIRADWKAGRREMAALGLFCVVLLNGSFIWGGIGPGFALAINAAYCISRMLADWKAGRREMAALGLFCVVALNGAWAWLVYDFASTDF